MGACVLVPCLYLLTINLIACWCRYHRTNNPTAPPNICPSPNTPCSSSIYPSHNGPIPPNSSSPLSATHDVPRHPTPSAIPKLSLSVELIERVADFLFEQYPLADPTGNADLICTKPPWDHVAGFMGASKELHRIGYVRWIEVVTIKTPEDWDVILRDLNLVREIKCLDGALIDPTHQQILSTLRRLFALSIDSHGDVTHDDDNRFTYRDLITTLPSSLRRLEILHAHGPDIKVIATVKSDCPLLEELRLGRCTIFNRTPACHFWQSFPFDHDSYISSEGTDSYAHSLAQELQPLKSLRSLRMGLYLVPSNIVLAHRLYHRRGLPAPEVIEWEQDIPFAQQQADEHPQDAEPATATQLVSFLHQPDPATEFGPGTNCAECVESTSHVSEQTETEANAILRNLVPSLTEIQWMAWLTPGHLGVRSYDFAVSK